MKKTLSLSFLLFPAFTTIAFSQKDIKVSPLMHLQNRFPLKQNPYIDLPFGSIKPKGWLTLTINSGRFHPCNRLLI